MNDAINSSVPLPFTPSNALDVNQDRTLEHLDRATPVRLIGTFENLCAAYLDDPISSAIEKARPFGFDYLPVRNRGSELIIGLFSTTLEAPTCPADVAEVMEPLGGQNLIAADAPLLHFIYDCDRQPCRLILDGAQITGLVTLSDIQKLPVRTALFSLFIHLEILLTELLRLHLGATDPFSMLSEERAKNANCKWKGLLRSNMEQSKLSALDFCDKRTLLKKLGCGVGASASKIKTEFETIENDLRNPIAHGGEYALSREAASRTAHAARLVHAWIDRLRRALATMPNARGA